VTNTTKETEQHEFALEELCALYSLAQSLLDATGRDQIVTTFLERLDAVVASDTSAVILSDQNSDDCEITHAAGEYGALLVGRKIIPGDGASGWVISNRHPFCNADPGIDLAPAIANKFNYYRTLAVFPILSGNDLYGAVTLYSSSFAEYDTTQQRLLGEAVGLLAIALAEASDATPIGARQHTQPYSSSSRRSASLKIAPLSSNSSSQSDSLQ
jgi:nitrate/nitrite-specific signal transduction histidine kinase